MIGKITAVMAAAICASFVVAAGQIFMPQHIVAAAAHPRDAASVSVNRADKGDRLRQTRTRRQLPRNATPVQTASPQQIPPGCEPAFSPVADPAHALVFKRCVV